MNKAADWRPFCELLPYLFFFFAILSWVLVVVWYLLCSQGMGRAAWLGSSRYSELDADEDFFVTVGEALKWVVADVVGSRWSPRMSLAWARAWGRIMSVMSAGATPAAKSPSLTSVRSRTLSPPPLLEPNPPVNPLTKRWVRRGSFAAVEEDELVSFVKSSVPIETRAAATMSPSLSSVDSPQRALQPPPDVDRKEPEVGALKCPFAGIIHPAPMCTLLVEDELLQCCHGVSLDDMRFC